MLLPLVNENYNRKLFGKRYYINILVQQGSSNQTQCYFYCGGLFTCRAIVLTRIEESSIYSIQIMIKRKGPTQMPDRLA